MWISVGAGFLFYHVLEGFAKPKLIFGIGRNPDPAPQVCVKIKL